MRSVTITTFKWNIIDKFIIENSLLLNFYGKQNIR